MNADEIHDRLRGLPAVDELLGGAELATLATQVPRPLLVECARTAVAEARREIQAGRAGGGCGEIGRRAAELAQRAGRPGTARAINATGVILHTGLGRAPLSESARLAVADASGYCLLEVDPASGDRQHRETSVAARLKRLTGAEAATVVNNNAAAVLVGLAALARGAEVICSRGELIEIGGSFRVPEVMAESGCRLVEVGATNRTHLEDYERAIGPATRVLLKVWPSNYRIIGFHSEVDNHELVQLGRKHGLPVMEDLGSGALVDLRRRGYPEPPVQASVAAGVDLVTFSGDKLLGGPQAGLIVGRAELVERVRRHPLFRAVRPDKLALAALDATLASCEEEERAYREVPVLAMMTEPLAAVEQRAATFAARLRAALPGVVAEVAPSSGRLGSGALPEHDVPSASVVVATPHAEAVHRRLRLGWPPVFARVKDDRLWLDMRTVTGAGELDELLGCLLRAVAE